MTYQRIALEKLATLIKDGTHGTHKNVENGPYLLSAQNIENGNIIINENDRRISNKDFNIIHRSYRLQNNDILITIVGSLGRCAILKNYNGNFTFQRSVAIIRFNKTRIIPKFAYYQIQTNTFQKELARRESKGAQGGVYLGELAKIQLSVPDLETQQKIVQILDTWNNAIDVIKIRLVQEDNLMKYLYAALLSGYKTTGKSNEYVDVELSKVANIERGKTLTAKEIIPGDIPVIAGGIDSPYNHNQYTHENVITVSASGANAGYVDYRHGKIWASDCNVIYGKEGISDTMYIFSWLVLLQKLIYQLQTGGAQPHVHAKDLAKLKISLPPLEIQQDIVMRLSTQAAKISRLEEYRDNLQNQYKYLLNHLISGDFDLTNIKLENGKEQQ